MRKVFFPPFLLSLFLGIIFLFSFPVGVSAGVKSWFDSASTYKDKIDDIRGKIPTSEKGAFDAISDEVGNSLPADATPSMVESALRNVQSRVSNEAGEAFKPVLNVFEERRPFERAMEHVSSQVTGPAEEQFHSAVSGMWNQIPEGATPGEIGNMLGDVQSRVSTDARQALSSALNGLGAQQTASDMLSSVQDKLQTNVKEPFQRLANDAINNLPFDARPEDLERAVDKVKSDFQGGVGALSGQAQEAFQNVKEQIGAQKAFNDMVDGAKGMVPDGAKDLYNTVSDGAWQDISLDTKPGEIKDKLLAIREQLPTDAKGALRDAIDQTGMQEAFMESLSEVREGLTGDLKERFDGVAGDAWRNLKPDADFTDLKNAVNDIKGQLPEIDTSAFSGALDQLDSLKEFGGTLQDTASQLTGEAKEKFQDMTAGIVGELPFDADSLDYRNTLNDLKEKLPDAKGALNDAVGYIDSQLDVQSAVDSLKEALPEDLHGAIEDKGKEILESLGPNASPEAIAEKFRELEGVSNELRGQYDEAVGQVEELLEVKDTIRDKLDEAREGLTDEAKELFDEQSREVFETIDGVKDVKKDLEGAVDSLKENFDGELPFDTEELKELGGQVRDGVGDAVVSITDAGGETVTAIVEGAEDVKEQIGAELNDAMEGFNEYKDDIREAAAEYGLDEETIQEALGDAESIQAIINSDGDPATIINEVEEILDTGIVDPATVTAAFDVMDCFVNPADSAGGPATSFYETKVCMETKKTMRQLMGNLGKGAKIAGRYRAGGKYWEGDKYQEHPWIKDPFGYWVKHMVEKDLIGFFENWDDVWSCVDFSYRYSFVIPFVGLFHVFSYYWPDVAVETNNFGVGIYASLLREVFKSLKDPVLEPLIARMDEANLPGGLRGGRHLGQSHTDDTGFYSGQRTRFYEAHTFRTIGEQLFTELFGELCDCFDGKYGTDEQWLNFSELLNFLPFWRFPEFSVVRGEGGSALGTIASMGLGLAEHGTGYLGSVLGTAVNFSIPMSGEQALKSATCAGSRTSVLGMAGYVGVTPPGAVFPGCFDWTYGQIFPIYPLVGETEVTAERTASMLAGRRFLEWTNSNIAVQKTPPLNDSRDKYNRLYPEWSKCFKLRDVSEYDNRFKRGINFEALDDEAMGEARYLHWQKYKCVTRDNKCFAALLF